MKALKITAVLLMALVSCKKETQADNLCDCREAKEERVNNVWHERSTTTPVKMDCWKHNEITQEWQEPHQFLGWNMPHTYRKRIICE